MVNYIRWERNTFQILNCGVNKLKQFLSWDFYCYVTESQICIDVIFRRIQSNWFEYNFFFVSDLNFSWDILHTDLLQHVSFGFLNRIFILGKEGESGKNHGDWESEGKCAGVKNIILFHPKILANLQSITTNKTIN